MFIDFIKTHNLLDTGKNAVMYSVNYVSNQSSIGPGVNPIPAG